MLTQGELKETFMENHDCAGWVKACLVTWDSLLWRKQWFLEGCGVTRLAGAPKVVYIKLPKVCWSILT